MRCRRRRHSRTAQSRLMLEVSRSNPVRWSLRCVNGQPHLCSLCRAWSCTAGCWGFGLRFSREAVLLTIQQLTRSFVLSCLDTHLNLGAEMDASGSQAHSWQLITRPSARRVPTRFRAFTPRNPIPELNLSSAVPVSSDLPLSDTESGGLCVGGRRAQAWSDHGVCSRSLTSRALGCGVRCQERRRSCSAVRTRQ